MKYKKEVNVPIDNFFEKIIEVQKKYFSNIDSSIKKIEVGTCTNTNLKTKLNTVVPAKLEILKVNYPYEYEQRTLYGDNDVIYQSFLLESVDESHTLVTYSEDSTFNKKKCRIQL
ncbi:hypothetical protein CNEO4_1400028 [Clostridium neonatale]|uniref:DUF3284 domain-containing protein n=1 Tax=Clostridium neonatale TaxID=137838 RepID=UPI00291C2013|nr:DUF3284 domain-containing protein [Clostridium neonatale]CAI3545094.1 hypothetical protein CNEO4_1400028 [Clostridium neonatale]